MCNESVGRSACINRMSRNVNQTSGKIIRMSPDDADMCPYIADILRSAGTM